MAQFFEAKKEWCSYNGNDPHCAILSSVNVTITQSTLVIWFSNPFVYNTHYAYRLNKTENVSKAIFSPQNILC
jgi:hypothetical protein